MKTKKIISMLLTACISLSTMAGLCTTASAEATSKTVYDGTGYTTSQTDNTWHSLYTGDRLSGANGEKYTITFEGKSYNNVQGYDFTLCDGDKTAKLYNKKNYLTNGNNTYESGTVVINNNGANTFNVKAVIDVDFSGATPTAKVKVYDHDLTTVLVNKTVNLTGFTGISDVVYDTWGTDAGYEKPQSPKLKIEKQVEVVNKSIYSGNGFTILDPENSNGGVKLSLYSGERLSGANGEKYTIIYEGKSYTNVSGYFFKLYDGETSANLWFKGGETGYKNSYDSNADNGNNIQISYGEANPFNVKAVIDVDFSGTTPKAAVKVYDHDLTTVLVDKTVDLTGFTGITDVLYNPWSTDVSGTMHYERPEDAKLTIKKESVLTWEKVYSKEVTSQAKPESADIKFYEGNLNDGGLYRITVKEHVYGQPTGNQMRVYSGGANFAMPWYKESGSMSYTLSDGNKWQAVTGNVENNLTAVCYADLTEKSLSYTLSNDKVDTTATGTVNLTGDSITSIVFHQYGIDTWSYPLSWSIVIEKAKTDSATEQDIELKSAKNDSGEIVVDLVINAVEEKVPYSIIAAFYKDGQLVHTDIVSGNVEIGESKTSESFMAPSLAYDDAYIYLWSGTDTIKPYDAPVQVK